MKDKKEIHYIPIQCLPINNIANEISLKELVKTILKYKKFLIGFIFILTILSIIYALYIAKPVYEIKANIEPGYINNYLGNTIEKNYIINPDALNLEIVNNFDNSKDKKNPFPIIRSKLIANNKIIELTLQDRSNLDAKKNLDKIFNYIKNKENSIITAYKNNINKEIEILSNTKKEYLKEIKDYQKKLNSNNPKVFQAILDTISKDREIIFSIESKIEKLKAINIKNLHYIGKVLIYDNPIKPKKKLIVIITFITSLILSIFIIFFIELIKSFKEEKNL